MNNKGKAGATPEQTQYTTLDDLWRPPAASVADRDVELRSRGSGRSFVVGGPTRHVIQCEAFLERTTLLHILTHPNVADVHEQQKFSWFGDDDRKHSHFFDFIVVLKDGRKVAVAVKPEEHKAKLLKLWPTITAAARSHVDECIIWTERRMTRASAYNALLLYSTRRCPNDAHDARVREVVATLCGQATIGAIIQKSGLGGDGFRAVVRLIDAGEIVIPTGVRIAYDTLAAPCAHAVRRACRS